MNKKKLLQIISCLLMAAMVLCGNTSYLVFADGDGTNKLEEVEVYIPNEVADIELVPGTTTHVSIPVRLRNVGPSGTVRNVTPIVNFVENKEPKAKIKNAKLVNPLSLEEQKLLVYNDTKYVEFDVVTKSTAEIGQYEISISFSCMDESATIPTVFKIPCFINKELKKAELGMSGFSYNKEDAVPGKSFNIDVTIKNDGELTALNPSVSIDFTGSDVKPEYSSTNIKLGDLANGNSKNVTLPVSILKTATQGTKKLTVKYQWKDEDGKPYEGSSDAYVEVIGVTKQAPQLDISNIDYSGSIIAGNDFNVIATVNNKGKSTAKKIKVSVIEGVSQDGIMPRFSEAYINADDIKKGDTSKIRIPMKVSKDATKGTKTITIQIAYTDADGIDYTTKSTFYPVIATTGDEVPELSFSNISYTGSLIVGHEFEVVATLQNKGNALAKKVKVSVADGVSSDSIMPRYSEGAISVDNLKKGETQQITIPLKVSTEATKGTKTLGLVVTWQNNKGVEYSTKTTIYPVVEADKEKEEKEEADKAKEDALPNIIVQNVVQSPAQPEAGSNVTLCFDVYNAGEVTVKQVKVGPHGLTGETLTPTSNDPYTYINEIKPGESKRVTMVLNVSKKVPEGYNTVPVSLSYKYGKKNAEETKEVVLGVLNVQNEEADLSKSVPKLIISGYDTDKPNLKANDVFTFHYQIKNTHSSVAAKNIKVTLAQAEGIFTATGGSNSTYIEKIQPGEVLDEYIELKVKADATTKAYPLTITMQYEYDGAAANPTTGKIGEEVVETINLNVAENCRPMVANLMVDNSSEVIVNESTTLSLDFYNQGKGPLGNVTMRVEGDFRKTDGDQQIIGLVAAGDVQSVEIDVTPMVEGEARGQLIVSYEDSNGEQLEMDPIEFSSFVTSGFNPEMNFDPGMYEPQVEAKKPIVPTWLFVVIQVAVFLVGILVARAIVIKRYKKKLEKQYED